MINLWNDMFWRLSFYFPSDSRFTWQNFGDGNPAVVASASRWLTYEQMRTVHYQSRPIARFAAFYANSVTRVKPSDKVIPTEDFDPCEQILRTLDAADRVNPATAKTFFHLYRSGKVPEWVEAILENHAQLEILKRAANI